MTALTSSCVQQRKKLLIDALFSIKDASASDECWAAFKCIITMPTQNDPMCHDLCKDETCVTIIEQECPPMVFIPAVSVLFTDIYFAYSKKDAKYLNRWYIWQPYICYNTSRYDEFIVNMSKVIFKNLSCYRSENRSMVFPTKLPIWKDDYLEPAFKSLRKYNLIFNYTSAICNRRNMYQCTSSSKCISIHRFLDGVNDCPHNDDEDITKISNIGILNLFRCQSTDKYSSIFDYEW
jgi:hypothetical protein